jgi:hypothetical protein
MTPFIAEWVGWAPSLSDHQSVAMAIFGAIVLFAAVFLRGGEGGVAERILVFVMGMLVFEGIRHFSLFVIAAAPFLYGSLCSLKFLSSGNFTGFRGRLVTAVWLYILLAIVWLNTKFIEHKLALNCEWYRSDEEAVLVANEAFPGAKILNNWNIGGALVNFGEGGLKHYVDGRAGTAFSESHLQEFIDCFQTGKLPVGEVVDKWDIDVALFMKGGKSAERGSRPLIEAGWRIFYENPRNVVLISPRQSERIQREGDKEE